MQNISTHRANAETIRYGVKAPLVSKGITVSYLLMLYELGQVSKTALQHKILVKRAKKQIGINFRGHVIKKTTK